MEQNYRLIFLAEKQHGSNEIIRSWLDTRPSQRCYLDDNFLHFIEYMISREGMFYRSRIVWAGQYDDPEEASENLFNLCKGDGKALQYIQLGLMQTMQLVRRIKPLHSYLVNHTKKQFVYMRKDKGIRRSIHPLPFLVGGTWARDIISVDEKENVPDDYTELVFDL